MGEVGTKEREVKMMKKRKNDACEPGDLIIDDISPLTFFVALTLSTTVKRCSYIVMRLGEESGDTQIKSYREGFCLPYWRKITEP